MGWGRKDEEKRGMWYLLLASELMSGGEGRNGKYIGK